MEHYVVSSVTCHLYATHTVRQLHREFLRAGSNVMQTFTFYASDDKLENRGQTLKITVSTRNMDVCRYLWTRQRLKKKNLWSSFHDHYWHRVNAINNLTS